MVVGRVNPFGRSGEQEPDEPIVRIGVLPAAHNAPTGVEWDEPLWHAIETMQKHDYSQLPVMSGPLLKGAITWESIGKKLAECPDSQWVRECMDEANVACHDTPLLDAVDIIESTGYVLVIDGDNRITGIVTASELPSSLSELPRHFSSLEKSRSVFVC